MLKPFPTFKKEDLMDSVNAKYVARQMPKKLKQSLDNGSGLLKIKTRNISIRLPETLISDLKILGKREELGYQTLAKQVLTNFVNEHRSLELQRILNENELMKNEIKRIKKENHRLLKGLKAKNNGT